MNLVVKRYRQELSYSSLAGHKAQPRDTPKTLLTAKAEWLGSMRRTGG